MNKVKLYSRQSLIANVPYPHIAKTSEGMTEQQRIEWERQKSSNYWFVKFGEIHNELTIELNKPRTREQDIQAFINMNDDMMRQHGQLCVKKGLFTQEEFDSGEYIKYIREEQQAFKEGRLK